MAHVAVARMACRSELMRAFEDALLGTDAPAAPSRVVVDQMGTFAADAAGMVVARAVVGRTPAVGGKVGMGSVMV